MNTSQLPLLHLSRWHQKATLRAIYQDYYDTMKKWCAEGDTLEIGSGTGHAGYMGSDIILTDIAFAPWLDLACDAQALPFKDKTFSNIILFDVLHHISRPARFLMEAERILRTGGRLIMLEPGITPVSYLFYNYFHEEDVDLAADSLDMSTPALKNPYQGNQGLPTQLFGRDKLRMESIVPKLKLINKSWLSLFAYPLSGGFKSWTLLPTTWVQPVLAFERLLLPLMGRLSAFRLFVVLEKQ